MQRFVHMAAATVGVLAALTAATASADHHFMQIEQVIAGVNGDATAQAIQLRMRSPFQGNMSVSRIRAHDANGENPVLLIDFNADVVNEQTGDRILIATANFGDYVDGPFTPDFVMTNPIPADYLAAGRITFEQDTGTIWWSLAWGGAGYTGSTLGSILNDDDGDYGPPFAGPLPSADLQALLFQGGATDLSTTNAADYALTGGPAVFTNNAGESFTVASGAPTVEIVDFDIVFGSLLSGGLAQLQESDDDRLAARSQFGFSASEANVLEIVSGFESSSTALSTLNIGIEGRVNNPGDTSKLRIKNWNTNAFQEVAAFTLGQTEMVHSFNGVDATNRVRSKNGRIEVSLRTAVVATFSAEGFDVTLDHVTVEAGSTP